MKKVNFIKMLILFFVFLFIQDNIMGQVSSAQKGTYQYIFKDRNMQEQINLTSTQLVKLESLRHNEKVVFVRITENTIIKLIPGNVVHSAQFDANATEENLYYNEIKPDDFGDANIYEQSVNIK